MPSAVAYARFQEPEYRPEVEVDTFTFSLEGALLLRNDGTMMGFADADLVGTAAWKDGALVLTDISERMHRARLTITSSLNADDEDSQAVARMIHRYFKTADGRSFLEREYERAVERAMEDM